jgi:phosphoenolpyruvate phosphomutase
MIKNKADEKMQKSTLLRQLLTSPKLEFLMEAHDGISAKIVEDTGFKGIWASGLTISASLGVRDNNEASWTQVLDVVEFMNDSTSLPILLDGDTGYGNFNNARRLVKKLEQRDIAGVCIEDKLFPKTNSFIRSDTQELADIKEFCGKIKAMKDIQDDENFVVVARVEAFIAGMGKDEALLRAEEYCNAGADAILIHSFKSNFSEIEAFMKEWKNKHPIIIVPTKYYSTPTEKFESLGISAVIWANQNLRASIGAMQKVSKQIYRDKSLIKVEDIIVPIAEVFRLQGAEELELAEQKYLPASGKRINTIILAASRGEEFGELTKEIPKTLLKFKGKTILNHQIDQFAQVGIKDITVVRGFAKDKVVSDRIHTIDNDDFNTTTELYSLYLAKDKIKDSSIVSYGDLIFKSYILNELVNDASDIIIIAEVDFGLDRRYHEYVKTDIPYSKKNFFENVCLEKIDSNLDKTEINGEFIGIFKVNEIGGKIVRKTLEDLYRRPDFNKLRMKDLLSEIIKRYKISVKYIRGNWIDINTLVDLQKSEEF